MYDGVMNDVTRHNMIWLCCVVLEGFHLAVLNQGSAAGPRVSYEVHEDWRTNVSDTISDQ
jgi:hypothetical protein